MPLVVPLQDVLTLDEPVALLLMVIDEVRDCVNVVEREELEDVLSELLIDHEFDTDIVFDPEALPLGE